MWISKSEWLKVHKELEALRRQVKEIELQLNPLDGPVYKAIYAAAPAKFEVGDGFWRPHYFRREVALEDAIKTLAEHLGVRFDLERQSERVVLVPTEKAKKK